MNYILKTKKLGDLWYLDIPHFDPYDIQFCEKIGKCFSMIDSFNRNELIIRLTQISSIIDPNTIFINDSDLLRYFTTDDAFDIRFYIKDHIFTISSDMYSLIEQKYNTNFHKTLYSIEISNGTM